jgi:hypothetical protein
MTGKGDGARQLVLAIQALTRHVEQCRARDHSYAAEHPDDLKGLLLPVEDKEALERLDGQVYGLAAAAGLSILPLKERMPADAIGYTGLTVLQTGYLPEPGQSHVILASRGEWDTRMRELLAAAEAIADGIGDRLPELQAEEHSDGPESPCWLWWQNRRHELPPRLWQVLACLWDRGNVAVEDLVESVWIAEGEPVSDKTIRSTISLLNTRLARIGVPRQYRLRRGYICRD